MLSSFERPIEVVVAIADKLEHSDSPGWMDDLVPVWWHLVPNMVKSEVSFLEEERQAFEAVEELTHLVVFNDLCPNVLLLEVRILVKKVWIVYV